VLLTEKNAPIQQIIDCGVVPRLIRFLEMEDNPALQLEAAAALTNVTIEAGAVPILIRLLSSTNEGIKSGAALILGNLVSDKDVKYRDAVLQAGAIPALVQAAENRICDRIAFAISNLCHGKPFPDFEVIRPALPLLRRCLDSQNVEVVRYSCLSYTALPDGLKILLMLSLKINSILYQDS
jgi:importin subunit alpha-1